MLHLKLETAQPAADGMVAGGDLAEPESDGGVRGGAGETADGVSGSGGVEVFQGGVIASL